MLSPLLTRVRCVICVRPTLIVSPSTAPRPEPQHIYSPLLLPMAMNSKSPMPVHHPIPPPPLYYSSCVFLNPRAQPLCIVLFPSSLQLVPSVDRLPLHWKRWMPTLLLDDRGLRGSELGYFSLKAKPA